MPEIINHTSMPLDEIEKLEVVGRCCNKWRGRDVVIYRYKLGKVISVGKDFDGARIIICEELDEEHSCALMFFPETYTYV